MVTTSNSSAQNGGNGLAALLAALQQGVTAINNLTQAMKTVFPSSS